MWGSHGNTDGTSAKPQALLKNVRSMITVTVLLILCTSNMDGSTILVTI